MHDAFIPPSCRDDWAMVLMLRVRVRQRECAQRKHHQFILVCICTFHKYLPISFLLCRCVFRDCFPPYTSEMRLRSNKWIRITQDEWCTIYAKENCFSSESNWRRKNTSSQSWNEFSLIFENLICDHFNIIKRFFVALFLIFDIFISAKCENGQKREIRVKLFSKSRKNKSENAESFHQIWSHNEWLLCVKKWKWTILISDVLLGGSDKSKDLKFKTLSKSLRLIEK